MIAILVQSTRETLLMVFISTLAGVAIGIPIAVTLFVTQKKGLLQNIYFNTTVGFGINAIRSIPFIILMVALMPFTRLVVGTTIGTAAASVSLSIAAITLMAKITEDALNTLPYGLFEAGLSMGATRFQIITKIILPEALPNIISGLTFVIINLIGFSAMAGAIGGGGLGDLAIRYGYQRYNWLIIIEVMIVLIVIVQIIQWTGNHLFKKLRK